MPVYKEEGKKNGKQKYRVKVYTTDNFGNQKTISKIVYGKAEADLEELRLSKEIEEQITPSKPCTLNDLCEDYYEASKPELRESTLYQIEKFMRLHVLPYLGKIQLDKLTVDILSKWKNKINKTKLAFDTKKGIYSRFNRILNYAVQLEYIKINHLKKIGNFKRTTEIKKKMNVYTPEEFAQYIKVAKEYAEEFEKKGDRSKWDFYVFFNIAFYTGMRKGEIFALKWSDVKEDTINIERSINQKLKGEDRETAPKNESSIRTIKIPQCLIAILNEHYDRWKSVNKFTEDFIICGGYRSIRETSVDYFNRRFAEKAGLKRIRIHDFRHSHATLLMSNKVNVKEIANRLGHTDVEMTLNTYGHAYEADSIYAVSILDEVNNLVNN